MTSKAMCRTTCWTSESSIDIRTPTYLLRMFRSYRVNESLATFRHLLEVSEPEGRPEVGLGSAGELRFPA
jgi:hypothetical protein